MLHLTIQKSKDTFQEGILSLTVDWNVLIREEHNAPYGGPYGGPYANLHRFFEAG